ncbi:glycosyltransferase family 9 protein [Vibrio agarivorans]|uniref:glycosyltransferase family 9 protein n=1 Tax=Vibrio agarivorans TaxID=153622 RepID=UPI0025B5463E|nr:glycosyltransferase family 9 protein [Vibrio agarivorans]MDN3662177.1 glycosyltransferase family 9 protein [Vibrio agarivorans]
MVRSICILRLSAIGDVCHALSVVQHIQNTYPQSKITWIMGKVEAQLLGDLPGVEVVVFDKTQGFTGMKMVWKQLSSQRFDLLLHMQVALRASVLTLGIRAKTKLGFSWGIAKEGQWLFTNQKLPSTRAIHVLDNFMCFASDIGCPKVVPEWFIPLSKQDESVKALLPAKYIVISPSASKPERNWLAERYAKVAERAVELGFAVVITGGPSAAERALADGIIGACQFDLFDLVGKTNLKSLCVVLRDAQVVIAPDSGPAHLATTQGTPVIGLYAHSNPKRTGPYNSLNWVVSVYEEVVLEQHGKPSKELAWGTRVKGEELMARITTDRVIETFERLISDLKLKK